MMTSHNVQVFEERTTVVSTVNEVKLCLRPIKKFAMMLYKGVEA